MLKKIIINILLILIAACAIEYHCFLTTKEENQRFKNKADKLEANNTRDYVTKYNILKDFNPIIWGSSSVKENSNKKPFIWFGCSFAEGAGLEDNETPCYKLSDLTGRSCINKSKGATGTQFMYKQLTDENLVKEVPEADFVIYTYIHNHLQRLYNYQVNPLLNMFNLRYKLVNGELKEIKPIIKPLYSSYFIKRLLNRKIYKQATQEYKDFKLFNAIMKRSSEIVKEKYPNAKFIMIEFPDLEDKFLPDYEVKELESYGITVVKVMDYTKDVNIYDKKYWLPDNIHPKSETWDFILPEIANKYMN